VLNYLENIVKNREEFLPVDGKDSFFNVIKLSLLQFWLEAICLPSAYAVNTHQSGKCNLRPNRTYL